MKKTPVDASEPVHVDGYPFYLPQLMGHDQASIAAVDTESARPETLSKPVLKLELSAILLGGQSPLAILGGKTYRIGDAVAPGWILLAIDGRSQTITVRSEEGDEQMFGIWKK